MSIQPSSSGVRVDGDTVPRHHQLTNLSGVGRPPGFLVPVHKFLAEGIVGRYLVKLTWQKEEGWVPLRDETKNIVLSPRCVSAFVGKDGRPYMYGGLAEIANDEGIVFVCSITCLWLRTARRRQTTIVFVELS